MEKGLQGDLRARFTLVSFTVSFTQVSSDGVGIHACIVAFDLLASVAADDVQPLHWWSVRCRNWHVLRSTVDFACIEEFLGELDLGGSEANLVLKLHVSFDVVGGEIGRTVQALDQ